MSEFTDEMKKFHPDVEDEKNFFTFLSSDNTKDFDTDKPGRWVTVNGAHIFIADSSGEDGPKIDKPTSNANAPVGVQRLLDAQKWKETLKPNEKKAFKEWTHGDFKKMREIDKDGPGDHPVGSTARRDGEKMQGHIDQINKALERAPKYEGKILRGLSSLSPGVADKLSTPGRKITLDAMSSFTRDPATANRFAITNTINGGHAVLLQVETKKGYAIDSISKYKHEKEVLMMKGSKFQVVSSKIEEFTHEVNTFDKNGKMVMKGDRAVLERKTVHIHEVTLREI